MIAGAASTGGVAVAVAHASPQSGWRLAKTAAKGEQRGLLEPPSKQVTAVA